MVLVSAFKTYGFGMDNSCSRADWTKLTQQRPTSIKKNLENWKAWFMQGYRKTQSSAKAAVLHGRQAFLGSRPLQNVLKG